MYGLSFFYFLAALERAGIVFELLATGQARNVTVPIDRERE
jgi:hypothetical protein